MPRIPTVEVSHAVLKAMFRKYSIWRRIRAGELSSETASSTPSSAWPDATSEIIKHLTVEGKHVATTHRVRASTGRVLHWDAKDLRLKGTCYWRA